MTEHTLYSEAWWAEHPLTQRCHGRKSNGEPCRRPAIRGAMVCRRHGGHLEDVKRRAAERIVAAADDAVSRLVRWLEDDTVPIQERRKIAVDLIDRAGLGPKQVGEVTVTHEWQKGIGGLLIDAPGVIDGEVIEDYTSAPESRQIEDEDGYRSKVEEEMAERDAFLATFPDAEVIHIHDDTPRDVQERQRRAWGVTNE